MAKIIAAILCNTGDGSNDRRRIKIGINKILPSVSILGIFSFFHIILPYFELTVSLIHPV